MSPLFRFSRLFVLGFSTLLSVSSIACGGADAVDADEPTMDEGELRKRSEDLFKPSTAPVEVVPSTFRHLASWEIYVSERGTTVIGRAPNKKAKAIFVQLVDKSGAAIDRATMRGSGYLVASDFRLDTRSKKHELELLAEAIHKDIQAALDRAEVAAPAATPPTTPGAESTDPTAAPEPTPSEQVGEGAAVPAPPPPAASDAAKPVKPCSRSLLKSLLFGIEVLKETRTTIVDGAWCAVGSTSDCAAAVASFERGVALVQNFDAKTCR